MHYLGTRCRGNDRKVLNDIPRVLPRQGEENTKTVSGERGLRSAYVKLQKATSTTQVGGSSNGGKANGRALYDALKGLEKAISGGDVRGEGRKVRLFTQTEEHPNEEILAKIFERMAKDAHVGKNVNNFKGNLQPLKNPATLYNFVFDDLKTRSRVFALVEICQGRSGSTVDYISFYSGKVGRVKVLALETTKTTPSQSGNAASQRMGKTYWVHEHFNGDVTTIVLFGESDKSEGFNLSPAWLRDLSIIQANGAEVDINSSGKNATVDISSLKDLGGLEKKLNIPKEKRRIKVSRDKKKGKITVTITSNLSKNGEPFNDPGIGFAVGVSNLVRKLARGENEDVEIVIKGHGLGNYLNGRGVEAMSRNKLFQAVQGLDIKLAGPKDGWGTCTKCNSFAYRCKCEERRYRSGEYLTPSGGEKVASIFLHTYLLSGGDNANYQDVFEHHAGSGLGYFYGKNQDQHQVANRIKKIPDLVVYDKKNNTLIVFEGKTAQQANKGVEDLDKLDGEDGFLKTYCEEHWEGVPVLKVLVTYGEVGEVPKQSKYPCIHVTPEGKCIFSNFPGGFTKK